jgi:hypothetical protein
MRIDSSGDVGIGTANPTARLNVVDATSQDAVRITQTGTGNALVVEDATNPDSTPFVVAADGRVFVGATTGYSGIFNQAFFQAHSVAGNGALDALRYSADAFGPDIGFLKSRSATTGTQAIISSGDALGTIRFGGSDGVAFIQAASISAAVDGTPGTNDMPGRLTFSTTADGASTPTERMRIDSSGDVGIGTASPTARLNVVDATSQDAVRITQTGSGNALVVEDAANPDSTPFVVDANGNVGIGTNAPAEELHINSGGAEFAIQWESTGSKSWVLGSATNRAYIRNKTDSVETLTILNNGNVGIGASPSEALTV